MGDGRAVLRKLHWTGCGNNGQTYGYARSSSPNNNETNKQDA